jgi:aminopeptidase N
VLDRTRTLAADESLDLSVRRRLVDRADELARKLAVRRAYPHQ